MVVRAQILGLLCITFGVHSAAAQTLFLPNKEAADHFTQSNSELIALYEDEDNHCRTGKASLSLYYSCAKRDILAAALQHRGYCLNSECEPGSLAKWKPCGLPSLIKTE